MDEAEQFKPKAHNPPDSFFNRIRFYVRLLVDLQVVSVYRHVRAFLRNTNGNLLDLGCGASPYRFLVNASANVYFGVDIADAVKFAYDRRDITQFDGVNIPFADDYFDNVLCTEVLEHVQEYQALVGEVYRVLKPGGRAIFTIPWSARYHYIPYDYFRYTPAALRQIFAKFAAVEIVPRGTDVTAISSKVVVLYFSNVLPGEVRKWIYCPLWLVTTPVMLIAVILGHMSLLWKIGSDLDPIGYTVIARKATVVP